jgi:hypothetical protein
MPAPAVDFLRSSIGWWLMIKWLQDYNYRINISWLVFACSGLAAIIIAVVTVSFQAGKAAVAKPVNSIKANKCCKVESFLSPRQGTFHLFNLTTFPQPKYVSACYP